MVSLVSWKKAVPGVLAVHCVIQRQHQVAKKLSGRLYKSMRTVITVTNKIKAHALNFDSFAMKIAKSLSFCCCTQKSGGCQRVTA